jgi:hypothetical protein
MKSESFCEEEMEHEQEGYLANGKCNNIGDDTINRYSPLFQYSNKPIDNRINRERR